MVRHADTGEIIVIRQDGAWSAFFDSWQEGEALADAGTPPPGLAAPERGLGKVWREAPGVREALGWAAAPEEPLAGAVEAFAGGRLLWTADRFIYALYADGSGQRFVDSFVDPTPTPQ